jgi:hypothetical protein
VRGRLTRFVQPSDGAARVELGCRDAVSKEPDKKDKWQHESRVPWRLAGVAILALSSLLALGILLVTDPWNLGDANSFLLYAFTIVHLTINAGTFFRQPGYPLLISATLYPWTLSFLGILAVQAVFAALIPWYIFKILKFICPRLAFVGGLISIATLLPYNYQTLIYPDQTQLFLTILLCYLAVKYVFASTTKNMVAMFVCFACLSFLRPPYEVVWLLIAFVVGAIAWQNRRAIGFGYYIKPLVALTIVVAGLHAAYSAADAYGYAELLKMKRPAVAGKLVFLNAFTNSVGVKGAFLDGKNTKILRDKLVAFFRDAPPEVSDVQKLRPQVGALFAPYQNSPEQMVDAIFANRTLQTWFMLFNISDIYFGQADGDELFMRVALEQYWLHPKIFWNTIVRGLQLYTLGYQPCEAWRNPPDGMYICLFYPAYTPWQPPENAGWPQFGYWRGFRPYTLRIVAEDTLSKLGAPFNYYAVNVWPDFYRVLAPTLSIITALGLLLALYRVLSQGGFDDIRNELIALSIVLAVYLFYIGPMMLLTDPLYRYTSAGVLLLLMSALISLRLSLVWGRAKAKSSGDR